MRGRAPRPSFVTLPSLDPTPRSVLEFLCRRFPQVGPGRWEARLRRGLVRMQDGTPVGPDTAYRVGGRVAYYREVDDEPPALEVPRIVHVDERFVIVDKPHGVPVVPRGEYVSRALVYQIARALGEESLAPAHRLDRDTAGLVLLTRRAEDRSCYQSMFAAGAIEKVYRAVAAGEPPEQRYWRVRSRIVPGTPWFRRRSLPDPAGSAVTDVYVDGITPGRVGFLIRPETGRQHQIRLHLAAIGYPILGDRLYPELLPLEAGVSPLQLLAQELAFRDPHTGRRRRFRSERVLESMATGP